jgi:hypothetical protein
MVVTHEPCLAGAGGVAPADQSSPTEATAAPPGRAAPPSKLAAIDPSPTVIPNGTHVSSRRPVHRQLRRHHRGHVHDFNSGHARRLPESLRQRDLAELCGFCPLHGAALVVQHCWHSALRVGLLLLDDRGNLLLRRLEQQRGSLRALGLPTHVVHEYLSALRTNARSGCVPGRAASGCQLSVNVRFGHSRPMRQLVQRRHVGWVRRLQPRRVGGRQRGFELLVDREPVRLLLLRARFERHWWMVPPTEHRFPVVAVRLLAASRHVRRRLQPMCRPADGVSGQL